MSLNGLKVLVWMRKMEWFEMKERRTWTIVLSGEILIRDEESLQHGEDKIAHAFWYMSFVTSLCAKNIFAAINGRLSSLQALSCNILHYLTNFVSLNKWVKTKKPIPGAICLSWKLPFSFLFFYIKIPHTLHSLILF